MPTGEEIRKQVTERILTSLENGRIPWHRPWKCTGNGMPLNPITDRPYRGGVNIVLLWLTMLEKGWDNSKWMGFGQAKKAGHRIKKEECKKYTTIFAPIMKKFYDKEEDRTGYYVNGFRNVRVYNVAQLEEWEEEGIPEVDPAVGFNKASKIVEDSGARIHHGGDRAFYDPRMDFIGMPEAGKFLTTESYWATLLHELTHWTGNDKRLKRMAPSVDREAYAFEELVAEIGSAFLCAHVGIERPEVTENHEAYVASWIKVLKNDTNAFMEASNQAWKAFTFLTEK